MLSQASDRSAEVRAAALPLGRYQFPLGCHLSSSCQNFLQSVTLLTKANAGGWTRPRRTPLSPEPTRAADVPPWRSSCRPGTPGLRRGSAARSRALQAGARRARAAAHGRVPSPAGRKPLDKLPLSLVSQRGEPRYAKSTSKKTSRATPRTLGGDAAPEADCGAGRSSAVWSSRPERGLAGNQGLFGPGLGPRLASRPRQGQSGQHRDSNNHPPGTSGSGTARGPRLPNGRNGTTKKDWR